MTYILAVLWLLVFAFSALPVHFFYNMDATCHTIDVLTETPASINQLCVDARQYGNTAPLPTHARVNVGSEHHSALQGCCRGTQYQEKRVASLYLLFARPERYVHLIIEMHTENESMCITHYLPFSVPDHL